MNISVISRNIGIALVFNAFFMFLGVAVSVIYDFDSSFSPLFLSAVITLTAGLFPLIFVNKPDNINIREGLTIIVLSWVLSCLFGMLPYVLWGGEFSLINAWYESVSGYTTTGATILTDVEALPKGLLFWRSSTHFIGGIGVVIFMLLILPTVSTFRMRLSKMEISSLSKENYRFRTKQTIVIIGTVYLGLNLLETVSLLIAGMDLFDAVNHSFSTIATGGFSTRNESILFYHSFPIELIVMIFMLLGGLHFGLLYSFVIGKSMKIFKYPIIRFYLATLLIGIIIVTFNIKLSGNVDSWWMALRESSFQVIACASTTGFATADSSVWPSSIHGGHLGSELANRFHPFHPVAHLFFFAVRLFGFHDGRIESGQNIYFLPILHPAVEKAGASECRAAGKGRKPYARSGYGRSGQFIYRGVYGHHIYSYGTYFHYGTGYAGFLFGFRVQYGQCRAGIRVGGPAGKL